MCLAAAASAGASPAFAEASPAPHWKLESRPAPTNLPLKGEGILVVTASNLGDADVNGEAKQVTITDALPAGLEATEVEANSKGTPSSSKNVRFEHGKIIENPDGLSCTKAPVNPIVCTFGQKLPPYEQLEVIIKVKVNLTIPSEPTNEVTVTGGEAKSESFSQPVAVNGDPTAFGVERLELTPENEDGSADTRAGSHPFQLTTTFNLNQTLGSDPDIPHGGGILPSVPALERNLSFKLPPGLIGNTNVVGNPNAVQQCDGVDFGAFDEEDINSCPNDTVVGVAAVTFNDPLTLGFDTNVVPVFNLVPAPGEPARFGFEVVHVPIILDTSVRTGEDYGVTVSVHNASEAVEVLGSRVTFWGVPGESSHDQARGWTCLGEGTVQSDLERPCTPLGLSQPAPFLVLPTSCGPVQATVEGEAWNRSTLESKHEAATLEGKNEFPTALSDCAELPFNPSLEVKPDEHAASTPTGLSVEVHVPQETTLTAGDRAEADVKATTLELPEGMQASAGAANGLETCSPAQLGLLPGFEETSQTENEHFSRGLPTPACPNAAKVGTVEIETPLVPEPLTGSVYMAQQNTNPFKSPLVLYVIAEEPTSRVLVKLAGAVTLDERTGRLVSTFENAPQTPFDHLTLHLFNTENESASQVTPAFCGGYRATAFFTPWSEGGVAERKSDPEAPGGFKITSGPGGTPCPGASLPFAPGFQAGISNVQAGAFTPFSLTINRPDGEQALNSIAMQLPPGIAARLSSVTPCQEPPVGTEWACGPGSLIGQSTSSSGLGGNPVTLGGQVYLTTGYDGAPFGLLDATLAKAGPFNLGMVYVRSRINVDPNTAAVTITTDEGPHRDAVPTILKGVPVQLKQVNVTVDRPEFQFNPTNCTPTAITGTLGAKEGASVGVSSRFAVGNCAALPFKPQLTASVGGHASKANGANLDVNIESAGLGQANIAKVDLTLPKALPSRLTTIQKACPEAVFAANPASCDEGSVIGSATVRTPVLKSPLTGPAYLVSHGGAAFPDVEFVLQGEGITLILDGKTDIKKGITYSRFESAPDAPFTTFETVLPAGPHSALTANVPAKSGFSLCGTSLAMPTEITGQNGMVISQTTKIAVTGCGAVKTFKATKAQRLAKAQKADRTNSKAKTKKSKRLACEKRAHKKYGASASKASKQKHRKKK